MIKCTNTGLMVGASFFGIAAFFVSASAWASEPPTTTPATDEAGASVNSDIVVTARRKEERLMDVPAAISVVSAETLKAKGISSPTDLVHAIPSLQQTPSGGGNSTPHFLIRGQRQQLEFIQNDQSVGVYVDEVVVPRQQGLNAGLFDIANVQVLKGPQGTLFGKNQTGGAILFSSQMPKRDFGGYFSATLGNYEARKIEGAINVPITDDFQIRAAGQVNRRDGYMHNVTDNRNYNDVHTDSWRVSAHYAPAGAPIENWLIVAGSSEKEIGALGKQLAERLGLSGGSFGLPVGTSGLFTAFGNPAGDALTNAAIQSQARSYGPYEAGGVSQYQLRNGNNIEVSNFSVTNKTELQISDGLTLRNIFGYRFLRSYQSNNDSGTPGFLAQPGTTPANLSVARLLLPLDANGVPQPAGNIICGPQSGVNCVLAGAFDQMNFTKQRQVSEEVNLLGKAFDGKLDFILGGYYFREHGDVVTSSFVPVASGPRISTAQNSPANQSTAVFGQITFHILPTVAITGGLRQTWDKRETNAKSVSIVPDYWPWQGGIIPADGVNGTCALRDDTGLLPNGACLLSKTANFNKLTYTASIDWHPTTSMLLYAASHKGYRSGGFNQSTTVNTIANPTVLTPFGPETVTDYELGFKGDWHFQNGMRAGLNVAAYRNNYDNIQRALTSSAALGTKSISKNAAKATIKGIEIEARFEPTPWLELTGYYSYIQAKFKSFIVVQDSTLSPAAVGDFTKSKFSGVPTDSGGATITLHTDVPGDKGRISASVDYYGQTGSYEQDNNFDAVSQTYVASDYTPGYWLLGANIAWNDVMGKPFDASFNVRNLNNKRYFSGGVDGATSKIGTQTFFIGEPRMYTFNLTYHF